MKKPMQTKIIVLAVTLIALAIVGFFLIRPVTSSIWQSWKDLANAKQDLKALEEKKGVLTELESNQNLKNVASIAENYVPKDTASGQLVLELTAMAQANNLKAEQISLEETKESKQKDEDSNASPSPSPAASAAATPPKKDEVKEIEFKMEVSGSFPDFMNFLRSIETSSRLISIKDISMQNKVSQEGSQFTAQITGVAYYKKEVDLAPELVNIKITKETLDRFLDLKSYGQPIDLPTESGFGRDNPFEGY